MLKPKYKLSGRPDFTFSLPGWHFAPLLPVNYATGCGTLYLHAVSSVLNCSKTRAGSGASLREGLQVV